MKLKKGFTLVELLIVIVVIGILSGMMMLSSTEAVSSAKAARIINNLRQWKTAALAWYIDNLDRITDKGQIKDAAHEAWSGATVGNFANNVPTIEIAKYLNGEFSVANANYSYAAHPVQDGTGLIYFADHLYMDGGKYKWLIGCNFGNDARVKEKLEARAATANLVQKLTQPNGTAQYKVKNEKNGTSNNLVFIEIMDFSK